MIAGSMVSSRGDIKSEVPRERFSIYIQNVPAGNLRTIENTSSVPEKDWFSKCRGKRKRIPTYARLLPPGLTTKSVSILSGKPIFWPPITS